MIDWSIDWSIDKVAGEVNEAILKAENADSAQSQLATNLKLLIWAQVSK